MSKNPNTVVRALTLPVGVALGMEWKDLNAKLNECWRLSTDLANWCVHTLYRVDTPGVIDKEAKPILRKWYGYGEAKKSYPRWVDWSGAMSSAQCIIRAVQEKYIQTRFDVMVRHDAKALTYRYPYPFPIHNQNWKTQYEDGDFPVVSVALPNLGRVDLRLKRRADFGRQLAMFRQLHDGTAKRGEAAIYRDGKGNVLVKLVGHFPRRESDKERTHTCFLHTDPNALMVAEIDGRHPWILNCDHLKRWQAIHRAYRQRMSEDLKREKRMSREQRADAIKSLDIRCTKHRHRIDTAVHQLSAQVARFCERQGVATVAYDDSVKAYIPDGFPWHQLKEKLRYKLDGVEWIDGDYMKSAIQTSRPNGDGEYFSFPQEERKEWLLARAMLVTVRRVAAHKSRVPRKSHPAVSKRPATCPASVGR